MKKGTGRSNGGDEKEFEDKTKWIAFRLHVGCDRRIKDNSNNCILQDWLPFTKMVRTTGRDFCHGGVAGGGTEQEFSIQMYS